MSDHLPHVPTFDSSPDESLRDNRSGPSLQRVLLVTDRVRERHVLMSALDSLPVATAFASSREDALRLADALRPDMVVLDVELEGEGWTVCEELCSRAGKASQFAPPSAAVEGEAAASQDTGSKLTTWDPAFVLLHGSEDGVEERASALGLDRLLRWPFAVEEARSLFDLVLTEGDYGTPLSFVPVMTQPLEPTLYESSGPIDLFVDAAPAEESVANEARDSEKPAPLDRSELGEGEPAEVVESHSEQRFELREIEPIAASLADLELVTDQPRERSPAHNVETDSDESPQAAFETELELIELEETPSREMAVTSEESITDPDDPLDELLQNEQAPSRSDTTDDEGALVELEPQAPQAAHPKPVEPSQAEPEIAAPELADCDLDPDDEPQEPAAAEEGELEPPESKLAEPPSELEVADDSSSTGVESSEHAEASREELGPATDSPAKAELEFEDETTPELDESLVEAGSTARTGRARVDTSSDDREGDTAVLPILQDVEVFPKDHRGTVKGSLAEMVSAIPTVPPWQPRGGTNFLSVDPDEPASEDRLQVTSADAPADAPAEGDSAKPPLAAPPARDVAQDSDDSDELIDRLLVESDLGQEISAADPLHLEEPEGPPQTAEPVKQDRDDDGLLEETDVEAGPVGLGQDALAPILADLFNVDGVGQVMLVDHEGGVVFTSSKTPQFSLSRLADHSLQLMACADQLLSGAEAERNQTEGVKSIVVEGGHGCVLLQTIDARHRLVVCVENVAGLGQVRFLIRRLQGRLQRALAF